MPLLTLTLIIRTDFSLSWKTAGWMLPALRPSRPVVQQASFFSQAQEAWMTFITDVPAARLAFLDELRKEFKVCLLSNTNPFIMDWARSSRLHLKAEGWMISLIICFCHMK